MKRIKIYQVDAFTDKMFSGNPAAVCVLDNWLSDTLLQNIAQENNLAETAFIVAGTSHFEIRWFTPCVEVELCGHATLAAAHIIFKFYDFGSNEITFNSPKSGILKVSRKDDLYILDLPADSITPTNPVQEIIQGIGVVPLEFYKGKTDYMALLKDEEEVLNVKPNLDAIRKLNSDGLIITAPGRNEDFVSRFFAPQLGIDEDLVTGSAHTLLTPFWAKRLKKKDLIARQLSFRPGVLYCQDKGDRVLIGGKGQLYLVGDIYVNE